MQQPSQSRNNPQRNNPGDRNASRGRGHSSGGGNRPPARRHHRPSTNIAAEIIHNGSRRLANASKLGLFTLALLAGGLMTLSALVALQLGGVIENPVWQQFGLAFGFTIGLFLVLACNSVLFTEVNILVPANMFGVKIGTGFIRLFLFWLIAWAGNYLGVCIAVILLKLAGISIATNSEFLKTITDQKLLLNATGPMTGLIPLFLSGVLANWVMGLATFAATYNRVAMSKIICLFAGLILVFVANFQFFPINIALLGAISLVDPNIGTLNVLLNHLIPISLGNLVGGAFLVSLPLVMQVRRSK